VFWWKLNGYLSNDNITCLIFIFSEISLLITWQWPSRSWFSSFNYKESTLTSFASNFFLILLYQSSYFFLWINIHQKGQIQSNFQLVFFFTKFINNSQLFCFSHPNKITILGSNYVLLCCPKFNQLYQI
jgi:hypothetical protein